MWKFMYSSIWIMYLSSYYGSGSLLLAKQERRFALFVKSSNFYKSQMYSGNPYNYTIIHGWVHSCGLNRKGWEVNMTVGCCFILVVFPVTKHCRNGCIPITVVFTRPKGSWQQTAQQSSLSVYRTISWLRDQPWCLCMHYMCSLLVYATLHAFVVGIIYTPPNP